MNDGSKEYLMLRDEIMKDYEIIQNSRNVLYVAVAAILAFAVDQKEAFLFLVPYIVIIPIYLVTIDFKLNMYKLGTYLKVFHEQGDFHWENRLYVFNYEIEKRVTRGEQFFHAPFTVSALVCLVMFFASLTYPESIRDASVGFTLGVIAAISLFAAVAVIFFKYRNIKKIQDNYINSWENVKEKEAGGATEDQIT